MITLKTRHGAFVFRLWPSLLTAAMLTVLIGLGTWQIQRLHWKESLLTTIDARRLEAPADVSSIAANADIEYRPAYATGRFLHASEFYLYAISLTGQGGYHVLTPLQLADGHLLLVDRGWVPYGMKPQTANPAAPPIARPADAVRLQGTLRLPRTHWLQSKNDPALNDWYGIDLKAMAKTAHLPTFLPFVLEVDAAPDAAYPIGGQTRLALPNNHLEYALTWYTLALTLVIIYGASSFRKASAD